MRITPNANQFLYGFEKKEWFSQIKNAFEISKHNLYFLFCSISQVSNRYISSFFFLSNGWKFSPHQNQTKNYTQRYLLRNWWGWSQCNIYSLIANLFVRTILHKHFSSKCLVSEFMHTVRNIYNTKNYDCINHKTMKRYMEQQLERTILKKWIIPVRDNNKKIIISFKNKNKENNFT